MKLPIHLNALRAFEASARHQSFSTAAEELHVTPAAVGQLVRSLEEWLDTPLFHRTNTGKARLIPTEAAEHALPDIRNGFDKLMLGLERLQQGSVNQTLTVAMSPSFAEKWLLLRLESFQTLDTNTTVRLDTNLSLVDFAAQHIDIGIRYGQGQWPGLVAEKLMGEEVYPVCSAQFLEQRTLHQPEDLLCVPLIHDGSLGTHAGFPTWSDWLNKARVNGGNKAQHLQINNSAAVLQSAVDGHGVALARSVMVKRELDDGRLIRLFPNIALESALAYYLVYRPECSTWPKIQSFKAWLFSEVKRG
ncbi:LysR substrate-binding domain-containing protein [Vibrio sp. S4M6]|uniref:LysR substrate-binding domain-containing protein n=1 Tax=Vibrio sinus TaxID=2946865 RepID=UPI00202A0B1C|nr:LysR substrate-binding domain-containing protein [Vibrio sinus]MCL9781619.1 LysR substrate-binding domain-containing protein [Vibrio sinus]